jgi:hypothetical protein
LETCVKDDCCAIVTAQFEGPDVEDPSKNSTYFEMYHGCKNDLQIHNQQLDGDCSTAGDQIEEDKCFISQIQTPESGDIDLNICVCKGDACNEWYFPSTMKPDSSQNPDGDNIECFSCGYKKIGNGPPEKIGDKPFCLDEAQPGAHMQTCKRSDDCCVEIHVQYTEDSENTAVEEVWHACKEEVDIVGFQTDVICAEAPDEIDPDHCTSGHVQNENAEVTVCACKSTTCNSYPMPSSQAPGSSTEGPHKTCYNCGYMQVDGGDAKPLPDEDEGFFCGDTVAPDSKTTDCIGALDDCCAIVSSYSIVYDEASSKNTTVRVVRHGCYNELAIHEHHHIECTEASDDISGDCKSFDEVEHNDNVFKEEICLCKHDFCNTRVPTTAMPPTTTPGGAANIKGVAVLVTILLSITLFH